MTYILLISKGNLCKILFPFSLQKVAKRHICPLCHNLFSQLFLIINYEYLKKFHFDFNKFFFTHANRFIMDNSLLFFKLQK